ncbi:hypothetical protein [Streptomyces sp. NPDC057403]|uniref:hypothetical protein n=1 Tax=Streptomyces sp. NPDC057403 TaxID=3346119 RepID=UPI0036C0D4A4
MTHILATLVLTAYIVGFLLCIGIAVDVSTQHPYDWMRTGSSQQFRIFLIFAPLFAPPLAPIMSVPGIYYLRKVRPVLALNASAVVSQGWPAVPRRPVLGLSWAWCELRPSQKVKTILAAAAASYIEFLVLQTSQTDKTPPRWLAHVVLGFLWLSFFFAAYLVLGVAQIYLNLKMRLPLPGANVSSLSSGMQIRAQKEYNRRSDEFYRRRLPPTGGGRGYGL